MYARLFWAVHASSLKCHFEAGVARFLFRNASSLWQLACTAVIPAALYGNRPAALWFLQHSSDALPCVLRKRDAGEDAEAVVFVSWISRAGRLDDGSAFTQLIGNGPALQACLHFLICLFLTALQNWSHSIYRKFTDPSLPFWYIIQSHCLLSHSKLVVLSYFQKIYLYLTHFPSLL